MNKRLVIVILFLILIFLPVFCLAQNSAVPQEELFKAKVIEVLEQEEKVREDDSKYLQQNLKLRGLEGSWKNQEIIYQGIEDIEVVSQQSYKVGDRVVVAHSQNFEGQDVYYITDYVRTNGLGWLVLVFILLVILVGKWKGLRALIVLGLTFLVILKFIIPLVLKGSSPLFITIIGSLIILTLALYLTEGFNKKSHIAILSILISLIITGILSVIFTKLVRLSGLAQEETMYLIGFGQSQINFQGLLLAGIIIGALGVLDDVVISQVALVKQLKEANPSLSRLQLYKKSMAVGISHLSAMVNTLFLAYAGVSLPLLILFSIKSEPILTFSQIINNEMIATEIVRTLTGSIGLILAVPIATMLAVRFLKK